MMKCFEKLVTSSPACQQTWSLFNLFRKQRDPQRMLWPQPTWSSRVAARMVSLVLIMGLPSLTCSRILYFLTVHSQRVTLGPHTSTAPPLPTPLRLNTGTPQGCSVRSSTPATHATVSPPTTTTSS